MQMYYSCNIGRELRALLGYGRLTPWHGLHCVRSYEAAKPHMNSVSGRWSSSEYNSNYCWSAEFGYGNSNPNNDKYSVYSVRPAVARPTKAWLRLRGTLQAAYEDCCRGKTSSRQCREYIPIANADLDLLTDELIGKTYQLSASTCFLVRFPKLREIFASAFRDRVIHHWISMRLIPHFERLNRNIGNVSHNCRVGFGVRSAVDNVYNAIKRITFNYGLEAYVFRGDLVGFFMSLPRRELCNRLVDFAQAQYRGDFKNILIWLIEKVVMHSPEKDCIFNSDPKDWAGLNANKSLFRTGTGRGSPIGNLTTQLFANFYMADFDAFMIDRINTLHADGIRCAYHRFVDDFVIVCSDKRALKALIAAAEIKIAAMDLTMHKGKRYIQKASHGIMFVGTYIKNHRLYLSNRTVGRFRDRVTGINRLFQSPAKEITSADLERTLAVLNSYLGLCKSRRTYRLRSRILKPLVGSKGFQRYFMISRNLLKVTLKKQWRTTIK